MTPRAQALADRCRRTERAVAAYAPIAGEALAARVDRPEEERAAVAERTTHFLLAIGDHGVRQAREDMTEADLAGSSSEAEHQRLGRRRDDLSGVLYRLLVDYRRLCRRFWRAEEAAEDDLVPLHRRRRSRKARQRRIAERERRYFNLSGKTPRDPSKLHDCAGVLLEIATGGRHELPPDSSCLAAIRKCQPELGEVLGALAEAEQTRRVTHRGRTEAITRCESVHLHSARIVEGHLRLVGRDDLAFEVRGLRAVGRPRKDRRPALWATAVARRSLALLAGLARSAREGLSAFADRMRRAAAKVLGRPSRR